ncbi:hypothetical protein L5849_08600 [Erythrobacter sp. SN021]|uniref:hypothetical protein n=1 Tax=Erythrobacter sp. SN021 TaxID=2912574 RepID=UPI001F3CBC52|nr:hypothetical protein [Erythrobacter sp. SN021]MCF8882757.1 hypothetical protein [Erythrobacter sp. SN021]
MIVIAALTVLVAAVLVARLLYSLSLYALPLWCGGTAAWWTFASGAGWTLAACAGLAAATLLLVAAHLLAGAHSPVLRLVPIAGFGLCGGAAGYHAAHGLALALLPDGLFVQGLSLAAAMLIGSAAALRWLAVRSGAPASPNPPSWV